MFIGIHQLGDPNAIETWRGITGQMVEEAIQVAIVTCVGDHMGEDHGQSSATKSLHRLQGVDGLVFDLIVIALEHDLRGFDLQGLMSWLGIGKLMSPAGGFLRRNILEDVVSLLLTA